MHAIQPKFSYEVGKYNQDATPQVLLIQDECWLLVAYFGDEI